MRKFGNHWLATAAAVVLVLSMAQRAQAQPITPQSRIVSGMQAYPGQFPWQVIIKQGAWDDLYCGGSVISDTWVLTAAHCCVNKESLLLVFGTVELENDDDFNMTVTQMFIHPQYNSSNYNNDVCLLMLPQPLQFSSTIHPIALAPEADANNTFVGSIAEISGFGIQDDENIVASQELLWATVQVITNSQCEAAFNDGLVIDSTICAVGYGVANMSICNGDSGGALVMLNANNQMIQIGINSFVALDRCTAGLPSAYARITSFLPFINSVTGIGAS